MLGTVTVDDSPARWPSGRPRPDLFVQRRSRHRRSPLQPFPSNARVRSGRLLQRPASGPCSRSLSPEFLLGTPRFKPTDPRLAASPAASAAWMPAEREAVRATTIEFPLPPGNICSPDHTAQVGTGPAGCRARHPKKENVLCGPPTHHHYISPQHLPKRFVLAIY